MVIRYMDGFDQYHPTTGNSIAVALTRNYTVVNDSYINSSTGRYTGMGMTMSWNKNRTYIERAGLSSSGVARFIVGFSMKTSLLTGLAQGVFSICASNATSLYDGLARKGLTFCRNGQVSYNTGDAAQWNGGVLMVANTWSHWEMVLPISPGVGNPTIIYKDGIQVYSSTHADSNFAWNGTLRIGSVPFSQQTPDYYTIDDLYILDDTGSTNNARLSTSTYVPRIETLIPTSTVANDFTLNGVASAHLAADNLPVNTGEYLSSTTVGHKSRFGVGDLTNINSIQGVQFSAVCSNSTAASNNWKFLLNNTEIGTTKTVTDILQSSTSHTQEVFELNPISGIGWTTSDINSAEIGVIHK